MSWCQNVSVPEYLVVIMSGCQKGGCQSVLVSKCPVPKCRRTNAVNTAKASNTADTAKTVNTANTVIMSIQPLKPFQPMQLKQPM